MSCQRPARENGLVAASTVGRHGRKPTIPIRRKKTRTKLEERLGEHAPCTPTAKVTVVGVRSAHGHGSLFTAFTTNYALALARPGGGLALVSGSGGLGSLSPGELAREVAREGAE